MNFSKIESRLGFQKGTTTPFTADALSAYNEPGVYTIINLNTGRFYVGLATESLAKRCRQHAANQSKAVYRVTSEPGEVVIGIMSFCAPERVYQPSQARNAWTGAPLTVLGRMEQAAYQDLAALPMYGENKVSLLGLMPGQRNACTLYSINTDTFEVNCVGDFPTQAAVCKEYGTHPGNLSHTANPKGLVHTVPGNVDGVEFFIRNYRSGNMGHPERIGFRSGSSYTGAIELEWKNGDVRRYESVAEAENHLFESNIRHLVNGHYATIGDIVRCDRITQAQFELGK